MNKHTVGCIAAIAIVWAIYAYMVWSDPMAICGLMFPILNTGMFLDALEDSLEGNGDGLQGP